MRLRDLPGYLRDTLLRMLPHRAPTGLVAIGNPGPDSPVLVTGNFTLTVRRLRDALAGRDAWLLVANSRGINVWCAAGGGHLTHHDVISVLRTSGIGERVRHRRLLLPQLAATGVERRRIAQATGWKPVWGPARLEDLPEMLRRGGVRRHDRWMRFPLWERLEMALVWAFPITLVLAPLLGALAGRAVGFATALVVPSMVFGTFAALPWLRITGKERWLTFAAIAALGAGLGSLGLDAAGAGAPDAPMWLALASLLAMGVLSIDLAGTTPWYGSYINTFHNVARIELVSERCTGAAECVQVCPRAVLEMNGRRRKVEIRRPDDCIQCGACIVQCPEDALRFRFPDGRVVEPATVRSTRLNLLGRRSVRLPEAPPAL